MNQSYLITGGNSQQREENAHSLIQKFLQVSNFSSHPDFLLIEGETSVGIELVRELVANLSLLPIQAKYKVAFLPQAQTLTLEAQNALLKTLEEPPSKTIIVLCCPGQENLLPTIISRCEKIVLTDRQEELSAEEENLLIKQLEIIFKKGLEEKFALAEKVAKNKQETVLWLDKLTLVAHNLMHKALPPDVQSHSTPDVESYWHIGRNFFDHLFSAKKKILANVNPRLALENFFLKC